MHIDDEQAAHLLALAEAAREHIRHFERTHTMGHQRALPGGRDGVVPAEYYTAKKEPGLLQDVNDGLDILDLLTRRIAHVLGARELADDERAAITEPLRLDLPGPF